MLKHNSQKQLATKGSMIGAGLHIAFLGQLWKDQYIQPYRPYRPCGVQESVVKWPVTAQSVHHFIKNVKLCNYSDIHPWDPVKYLQWPPGDQGDKK